MSDATLLEQVFEALPHPTFLVDGDVQVYLANRAARALAAAGESGPVRLWRRGGDVLHCVHVGDHPEGCGRGPSCETCAIRGSVGRALGSGAVVRTHATVELCCEGQPRPLELLVSAAPVLFEGAQLAVLVLEPAGDAVLETAAALARPTGARTAP